MKKQNDAAPEIKVEKGIPMPSRRSNSGLSAAIEVMDVGDSFRVKKTSYGAVRTLASAARISVSTRADGEGFIRVWRRA